MSLFEDAKNTPNPVDPWAYQRALMGASDQKMADAPELNKGVLLYLALNSEEFSEILEASSDALSRHVLDDSSDPLMLALANMRDLMYGLHEQAMSISKLMRKTIKDIPDSWSQAIGPEDAEKIAKEITDLNVTNAGLALSFGMPGGPCYEEVAGSNLSKANPDTGKIDKLPDGKWIKNERSYREADLSAVLYGKAPKAAAKP